MRLRVIEQPWEIPSRRFAVQEHVGGDLWRVLHEVAAEQAARDLMALRVAGPKVIAESAIETPDSAGEQHEFHANALQ